MSKEQILALYGIETTAASSSGEPGSGFVLPLASGTISPSVVEVSSDEEEEEEGSNEAEQKVSKKIEEGNE
eukprot:11310373-Alexandrium_andersonii.AAC.1